MVTRKSIIYHGGEIVRIGKQKYLLSDAGFRKESAAQRAKLYRSRGMKVAVRRYTTPFGKILYNIYVRQSKAS